MSLKFFKYTIFSLIDFFLILHDIIRSFFIDKYLFVRLIYESDIDYDYFNNYSKINYLAFYTILFYFNVLDP